MSWDETYTQLVRELGHKPSIPEVQEKMLEIAARKLENDSHN